MSFNVIDTYAAAFAAVFGGIGVKVLDKLMSKRSEQFLEATKIREELRAEVVSLRKEVDDMQVEVDVWREKYYDQMNQNLILNQIGETLRIEIQRLQMIADPTKAPPTK
jgi:hypothetical protein